MAYGFGARTHVRGEGQDACDLFSLSGNFTQPFFQSKEQALSDYEQTLKTVRLALPVKASKIIKYVCDMAQMEYGTCEDVTQIKNYYVMTLLMAGVVDDMEDSIEQILRAKDMPISIIIVKVGAQDEQDAHNLY